MTAPSYTATAYVDNSTAVPISAANLNKEENQTAALTTALNNYITSNPLAQVVDAGAGGTADDSTAFQAAVTSAANKVLQLRPNTTYTVQDVNLPSNITIRGMNWSSIIKQKSNAADNHYALSVNAGTAGSADPTTNLANIVVENCQLQGTVSTDGFMQHQYLLNLNACSNVTVSRVKFYGWRGDAIYLGSSNSGGVERHNLDVLIDRCFFDGATQDNRNAVSIIDGQRVKITHCTFVNCTRADMPGAVDIEPNSGSTFARLRDIKITHNSFWNVRAGIAGVVALVLHDAQASYTTPMEGLEISFNDFHDCTGSNALIYLTQSQTPGSTSRKNGIVVRGNRGYGIKPYEMAGVRGVTCRGNSWESMAKAADLGYSNQVRDVTISGDEYSSVTGGNGFVIYRATNLTIEDCDLTDFSVGNIYRLTVDGAATGASDELKLINNRAYGTGPTAVVLKDAGHTVTATANNVAYGNDWSAVSAANVTTVFTGALLASTDIPSVVIKTVSATTYTFVADDAGKLIQFTAATAVTATVPANVFSAGQQIVTAQRGAGQVTHAAGAGFTLTAQGSSFKTTGQYAKATLTFFSATTADLDGNTTV
jgi:hypothetical protein